MADESPTPSMDAIYGPQQPSGYPQAQPGVPYQQNAVNPYFYTNTPGSTPPQFKDPRMQAAQEAAFQPGYAQAVSQQNQTVMGQQQEDQNFQTQFAPAQMDALKRLSDKEGKLQAAWASGSIRESEYTTGVHDIQRQRASIKPLPMPTQPKPPPLKQHFEEGNLHMEPQAGLAFFRQPDGSIESRPMKPPEQMNQALEQSQTEHQQKLDTLKAVGQQATSDHYAEQQQKLKGDAAQQKLQQAQQKAQQAQEKHEADQEAKTRAEIHNEAARLRTEHKNDSSYTAKQSYDEASENIDALNAKMEARKGRQQAPQPQQPQMGGQQPGVASGPPAQPQGQGAGQQQTTQVKPEDRVGQLYARFKGGGQLTPQEIEELKALRSQIK